MVVVVGGGKSKEKLNKGIAKYKEKFSLRKITQNQDFNTINLRK